MTRLPFDPDRIAAPPSAAGGRDDDRPMSVSQVAALIRDALAAAAPRRIRVVGEVSNFSARNHWFFSIKDEQAALRCVCFASSARKIKTPVADGMQIVAAGRLDYYDAQGHVQLYVDRIEPIGEGALELQFRQLCEQLRKLGYFDDARKRPLPMLARRIAVVSSRSGAALQDVINTAGQRWGGCQLLLYDVRVQGEQAAGEIAAAINVLSKQGSRLNIDAILLTRGGGSIEDLWAFNERAVADAVFNCSLPVVAAIGHETDTTIAELVADARSSTPTQAAMLLVPDATAVLHQVGQYARRLDTLTRQRVAYAGRHLESLRRSGVFSRPRSMVESSRQRVAQSVLAMNGAVRHRVAEARQMLAEQHQAVAAVEPRGQLRLAAKRVDDDAARLAQSVQHRLAEARLRLDALGRQLEAVGPTSVLGRGFTYTIGPDGRLIRSVKQVRSGDTMTTVVSDGRIGSTVDAFSQPAGPDRKTSRRQRAVGEGDAPPGLFG